MPRIKEEIVYTFDELNDAAKEKARNWYREWACTDNWYEDTLDDAKECLSLAGFKIDQIFFSGFSSQGDGACFDGSWRAGNAQPVKAMKQHAPKDKELHRIAAVMRDIARKHHHASMSVKHRGHYYHQGCTEFFVDAPDTATETAIIAASRDAMQWIYRQLEQEHDYLRSDAVVDETILANGYEFTEKGVFA